MSAFVYILYFLVGACLCRALLLTSSTGDRSAGELACRAPSQTPGIMAALGFSGSWLIFSCGTKLVAVDTTQSRSVRSEPARLRA